MEANNFLTHKILPTILPARFERGPSELPFAYSRVSVPFLIRSKMATDFLEKFQAKN